MNYYIVDKVWDYFVQPPTFTRYYLRQLSPMISNADKSRGLVFKKADARKVLTWLKSKGCKGYAFRAAPGRKNPTAVRWVTPAARVIPPPKKVTFKAVVVDEESTPVKKKLVW